MKILIELFVLNDEIDELDDRVLGMVVIVDILLTDELDEMVQIEVVL